ncbi:hypothetical protein BD311DRAFT_747126 [Dichomitus squalens]|uniref:Uncharacterized protein n=1 Tax=Dichomitus squalens TaxID=114155 RepID=A0A4Q9N0W8_9APHY|nr:hypothetical protein BD311DRAFT_747126 [Dichomitus squalens]
MSSPASRLTPLEEDAPLPFEATGSLSVVTRSRKRAAADSAAEPRPPKRSRKGKQTKQYSQTEPSGTGASSSGATASEIPGPGPSTKLTAQAQERRAELLRDPRARMVDLFSVRCLKCGTTIKLSPKGYFDLHHWSKHRKRCDKWSEEYAAARRAENGIDSSRLSTPPATPPLTEDCGTEFTGTSAMSIMSARSPTPTSEPPPPSAGKSQDDVIPPPREDLRVTEEYVAASRPRSLPPVPEMVECPIIRLVPPLTSHKLSKAAMALHHPGLEVLDLNRPLPTVRKWEWGNLQPSIIAPPSNLETEEARNSVRLSKADWNEEDE